MEPNLIQSKRGWSFFPHLSEKRAASTAVSRKPVWIAGFPDNWIPYKRYYVYILLLSTTCARLVVNIVPSDLIIHACRPWPANREGKLPVKRRFEQAQDFVAFRCVRQIGSSLCAVVRLPRVRMLVLKTGKCLCYKLKYFSYEWTDLLIIKVQQHIKCMLKMLGLYLHTLIISHKSCIMLSILNKLILQKTLQNIVTNNVFMDKKIKTQQQQNKKSNLKTLAGTGNWTRDLLHPKRMRYHCTTESSESIDC